MASFYGVIDLSYRATIFQSLSRVERSLKQRQKPARKVGLLEIG